MFDWGWVAGFVKDVATVLIATGAIVGPLYRYAIKPRCVEPFRGFMKELKDAVAAIHVVAPQVKTMSEALGPNGGKSLADVIYRTSGRLNQIIDASERPTWEASATGENTRANPAFEHLVGYSAAELRGNGWKNLLHWDDAEDYFDAWESAVRDVRQFKYEGVRLVTSSGRIIKVNVVAAPTFAGMGPGMVMWMGSVSVVKETP